MGKIKEMKKQKKLYYIYLNSMILSDLNYELSDGNYVFSDYGSNLINDSRFNSFHHIFENFKVHSFLILEITNDRFHDLFKLAVGLTMKNFWAFQYFMYCSDEETDNNSNFPVSLFSYPEIANLSFIQKIIHEQFVSRFSIDNLTEIKLKIEQLNYFYKKQPSFEDRFYNSYHLLSSSHLAMRNKDDFRKSIVDLITAYETLLHFESKDLIVINITKRLEYIHLTDKYSLAFKALYGQRSNILHGEFSTYSKMARKIPQYNYLIEISRALVDTINLITEKDLSIKSLKSIRHKRVRTTIKLFIKSINRKFPWHIFGTRLILI